MISVPSVFSCTGTATSAIHTLSLHDALPIFARSDTYSHSGSPCVGTLGRQTQNWAFGIQARAVKKSPDNRMGFPSILAFLDRKSTRLNSSHVAISYAVFCLKQNNENGASHDP